MDKRSSAPDPRELEKLARDYAQSRTIPFLVLLVFGAVVFGVLLLIAWMMVASYYANQKLAFWIWLFALSVAASLGMWLIFVNRWGVELRERISERLYGPEGSVTFGSAHSKSWRRAGLTAGILFCICLVITSYLIGIGKIPRTHMQPVSAIFTVPFLIFLVRWLRPLVGPWGLLWPALYGLHAILIAVGVSILFTGPWKFMNMIIPIFGYGVITGLLGHWHSRRVLSRLRSLAHVDDVENDS